MDHSAMSTLLTCPRKYEYLYRHRKAEEQVSNALKGGTFWHKILECHADHGFCDVDDLAQKLQWQDPADDYRTLAKYRRAYEIWRAQVAHQYRFLDAEFSFLRPVDGTTEPVEGRIDGLVEWDSNQGQGTERWILDAKTTGRLESNWVQTYRLSDQFQLYTYEAQQRGLGVAGVVVDVFHCTKGNKSGKSDGEREGIRFYQLPIRVDPLRIKEALETFRAADRMVQQFTRDQYFPPNRSACKMYNRTCGFADVCDTSDPNLRRDLLLAMPENTFSPHTTDD